MSERTNSSQHYQGSCHCGAIKFEFDSEKIENGLRCNCSICQKKGTLMSAFTLAPEHFKVLVKDHALATYEFGSEVAKHHFCKHCGIYTFHQTLRKPGHYRVNLGCIEGLEPLQLATETFDGRAL